MKFCKLHSLLVERPTRSDDIRIIEDFIREYLEDGYGEYSESTIKKCRHGGCFEFADSFQSKYPDAEMWETIELYDEKYKTYPLIISYDMMKDILQEQGETDTGEVGWHGTHAVVKWRNLIFDSAGISSFDEVTNYFNMSIAKDNVHWIRTQ